MKTNNSVKLEDTIWKPDKANGEKATVFFCFKRTEHTQEIGDHYKGQTKDSDDI